MNTAIDSHEASGCDKRAFIKCRPCDESAPLHSLKALSLSFLFVKLGSQLRVRRKPIRKNTQREREQEGGGQRYTHLDSSSGLEFSGESTQRGRSMWLCTGLLLLCFQGCLSLTGPGSVSGYAGGSLHVQCRYTPSYKGYIKYWCRGPHDTTCKTIVETDGSEKEKKSGRVSIRDYAENSTITVIMENLSEDDAGSYWCKIQTSFIWDSWSRDPSVRVKVHVFPATTPMETTLPATTAILPLANSGKNLRISTNAMFIFQLWSLMSSIHFQVLVFLKLPLFLSMLCAIFWVNRLWGIPGGPAQEL